MSAKFKVATRISEQSNDPLLVMTVQVEAQVVLNPDRLTLLKDAVSVHYDGVEHFTTEEKAVWERTLEDLRLMLIRLREVPVVSRIGLESQWQELPTRFLHEIVHKYVLGADSTVKIMLDGRPPDCQMIFNIGAASVKCPLRQEEISRAEQELDFVRNLMVRAKTEGKTGKEISDMFWDSVAVGSVTVAAVKCAGGIAAACETGGIAGVVAIGQCAAAAAAFKAMIKTLEEQQQQEIDQSNAECNRVREMPVSEEVQRGFGDKIGGFAEPTGW